MREKRHVGKEWIIKLTLMLTMAVVIIAPVLTSSEAAFTSTSKATVTAKSDTLQAPASITLNSLAGGQTQLTWTPSTSSYTTGYKILRSNNTYGPWTELGTVSGRTTTSYTDTKSGTTQWIYRVESIWGKWVSTSAGFEAPPVVGRSFYDGFDGPAGTLDGRTTQDGLSVWQVWSGDISVIGGGATGTPGSAPAPNNGDVAVVRTPANDGWVFASDFDGYERVILRGKDPQNYVYAGGADVKNSAGNLLAEYFEIAEIRNGVKTILGSTKPGLDRDFRVEIRGNTIKAYIDAVKGDPTSGTLHLSATSTFQQTDPAATYFGIGFNRGGFGINDFTFQAY